VLADQDGVRANMSASWLAQMGWDVWVLDGATPADFTEKGLTAHALPEPQGLLNWLSPAKLSHYLQTEPAQTTAVLDLGTSVNYVKRHIPGAWFVLRSELRQALQNMPPAKRYVLTCDNSQLARYASEEVKKHTGAEVFVLQGGTQAWLDAALPVEQGETRLASARTDRYRRPYEGTDSPRSAMQAYLDWEFGLVAQLALDGTHGFKVI